MEPQDDPEARIRALEQPLADTARATELGATQYPGGDVAPPLPPMPPQPQGPYAPPGYAPPGYPPPGYGAPWQQPPRKSSAGIPWAVFVVVAVVVLIIAGGVGVYIVNKSTSAISSIPSINMPSRPTNPPPGGQLSVAGMGQNKRLDCDDNTVSISGVSNHVTITGHCKTVTVSGMQNQIAMDTADRIQASGFDNVITYHSGSPDINNAGNNVVQQG